MLLSLIAACSPTPKHDPMPEYTVLEVCNGVDDDGDDLVDDEDPSAITSTWYWHGDINTRAIHGCDVQAKFGPVIESTGGNPAILKEYIRYSGLTDM